MKQSILVIIAAMAIIFAGCTNNDDPVRNSGNHATQVTFTKSAGFSTSQQSVLRQLQEINDSISSNAKQTTATSNGPQKIIGSINFGKIVAADVEGFKIGWKNSWQKRRFFFLKLITATADAIASSAKASADEFEKQWNALTGSQNRPISTDFTVKDYLISMALVWDSEELNTQVDDYMSYYPSLVQDASYEEIKAALAHNSILTSINSGLVYPEGILMDFFSEEQLQYFNSILRTISAPKYYHMKQR